MRKRLILLASLFVVLFELLFIRDSWTTPIAYIPLLFGLLSLVNIDETIKKGPGIKVAFFIMCVRYLLMPPMLLLSGYFSYIDYQSPEMSKSFFLIVIEMIAIFMTLGFSKPKQHKDVIIDATHYSYLFPILLLLVAAGLSISDPIPLSRYHFILSGAEEMVDTDLDNSTQGLPRFLGMVHYILIASVISAFYGVYTKKKSKLIYWIGLFLTILLCCFYQDTSRNSMLIPLLATLFMFNKLYKQYRKQTTSFILTIVIVSMSLLTLIKQFEVTTLSALNISNSEPSLIFERYFGGVTGVYDGFKHEAEIANKIDGQTLLTEVFGKVIGLNRILDQTNRTSNFYNDALGSHSFIIPTISEGYFHFSWLLCWLFTFAIFKLIILFDGLYARSKRIDLAFVFVSLSVTLGWMHTGNFIICMNSFHMSMTILVIFLFSVILGKIKIR